MSVLLAATALACDQEDDCWGGDCGGSGIGGFGGVGGTGGGGTGGGGDGGDAGGGQGGDAGGGAGGEAGGGAGGEGGFVPPESFDLTVTGSGQGAYDAVPVVLQVTREEEGELYPLVSPGTLPITRVDMGTYSITAPEVLIDGRAVVAHVLLDLDDDGVCDRDTDVYFERDVGSSFDADLSVAIEGGPLTSEADLTRCESVFLDEVYDIALSGQNFPANKRAEIRLWSSSQGSYVAGRFAEVDTSGTGSFSITLEGWGERALNRTLAIYIDQSGEGGCDPGESYGWNFPDPPGPVLDLALNRNQGGFLDCP